MSALDDDGEYNIPADLILLDFYCEQNHFVEFGMRKTKSTDKDLLQLLKTI